MELEETLRRLSSISAPSGFERPVALVAKKLLEPLMDEVRTDRLGNVIGVRRCRRPKAKKLLLDAHLDEVGMVVIGHKGGFLRFASIGVDPRMLPDREVTVLTDPPLLGVVVCLPPHVLSVKDREKAPELKDMFVDIGLDPKEVERRIPIGTPMVFRAEPIKLGKHQLCGKALDDRACFTALLRAAELIQGKDLNVDLYILGSVCEETTSVGAKVGMQALVPDFCVAVDVTHGKTPDSSKDEAFTMGGGPVVGIGPNCTRWITKKMLAVAEKAGIQVQKEIMEQSSGTNGWEMQICNEGVTTAVLSLPLKYMHTPVETVELSDIENTAQLLAAFVMSLREEDRPEW